MLFDGWKKWFGKGGAPARRQVVSVNRRRNEVEHLEERFLLGELTLPMGVNGGARIPEQLAYVLSPENAGNSAVQLPRFPALSVAGLTSSAAAGTAVASDSSLLSTAPVKSAAKSQKAVSSSSAKTRQVKSALQEDKLAAKAEKQAAKAAAKAAKQAARELKKLGKQAQGTDSEAGGSTPGHANPGSAAAGGGLSPTTSSPGTGTVDPGVSPSGANGSSSGGTSGGGTVTTVPGGTDAPGVTTSSSQSPEAVASVLLAQAQLTADEVDALLKRASAATQSEDAIIVVVDRQGYILGVRTEADVSFVDLETLVYSIDGAVAEARTAAFFSNDQGVLTSRTIRFISQSTITEREVISNPSIVDPDSTIGGPGFVGPIGIGGHYPPGVMYTPPVDLFGIEHSNRDSVDIENGGMGRFNGTYVTGQDINAPKSYGVQSERLNSALPRGIGTLPGGIPLYRDTTGDGVGDKLIGGIGVFFPGTDESAPGIIGDATFEQGFVHGDGKSATARTNAPKALEAEFMALAAIGSSRQAGVKATEIGGVAPVTGIDLPFPRIDLVGITLEAVGPTAGIEGVGQLLRFGANLGPGFVSGINQPVLPAVNSGDPAPLFKEGTPVPSGWLIAPQGSGDLSSSDVQRIIEQGIQEALRVRAAIRSTAKNPLGLRTRMVFAVTDTDGKILGLYRMDDATYFSIDVAVAKARNMAYYNDPADLEDADQVLGEKGVAFTSRTVRFLAEPRYPAGVDGTKPPPFSILNEPSIDPKTAENRGLPAPLRDFQTDQSTVLGYDAFNIGTNFRDASSPSENQNGVVFFPGSSGIYKNGVLVGGVGVSGDGVDQDDVVTVAAATGFNPPSDQKADRHFYRNVRLPYTKFLRNPYG